MPEIRFSGQASDSMGDVTDASSRARVWLGGTPFTVVRILGTFTGAAGSATLQMLVDSNHGTAFDHVVAEWATVGSGSNRVLWMVPQDERQHYTSFDGDPFVFEWTNPTAQSWGMSVWIEDATQQIN